MPATAQGAYATTALIKARLNITNSTDDTVLGSVCDQVNQAIETISRRVLAPVSSATFLLDGDGSRCLHFGRGIRAISVLAVGSGTGQARVTLASTDYFLRPAAHDRLPGFPATEVWLSDIATVSSFGYGFDTVSMTATTGFDAIPDDVTDIALTVATRAWHAVQAGQTDVVGTDDMGRPIVSRVWLRESLDTIRRTYGLDLPG